MISNDEFMVILGRQWIQPQVKDFLFTGELQQKAQQFVSFFFSIYV